MAMMRANLRFLPGSPSRILFLSLLLLLQPHLRHQDVHAEEAMLPETYRLMGTVTGRSLSGAVIADAAGLQSFYRVHDRLPDGSTIVQVREDGISIKRTDGAIFTLSIAQRTGPSAAPAQTNAGLPKNTPALAPEGPVPPPPTDTVPARRQRRHKQQSSDEE